MKLKHILSVGAACLFATGAYSATIDFETVPGTAPSEGLAISNQFEASAGVTFSLSNGSAPVLADYNGNRTAYQGPGNGNDNLDASELENLGSFFLTDDGLTSGSGLAPVTLIVTYSQASSFASGSILDIDFGETFEIKAFDSAIGGSVLDSIVINAGDTDTGNGIATNWSFNRATADIQRIEFFGQRQSSFGFFGLGFDNFNSGVTPQTPGPSPVPLPAGLPLLALGLCAFAFVKRQSA